MVYYEETKLISNWQLNTVLALSSSEAPSVEKRRENGEIKKSGARGGGGGGGLNFSSPHSPAYGKDERELCGGESTFSAILVQQQNIPLYFSFTSRVCILKISQADSYIQVTQITTPYTIHGVIITNVKLEREI